MTAFQQPSLNLDLKQDASLNDFDAAGFRPVLNAVHELALGNLQELFIIGASGFGKSHLATAIYRNFTQQFHKQVIILALDEMIHNDDDSDALLGLEMFDLIIIDDLQLVRRSAVWQEALFHLINRVREQQKQMIFLADNPARELGIELLDLVTRLSLAPNFRLPANEDINDRQAILSSVLRHKNWRLPEPIFQHLLEKGPANAGDMIQILDHISPLLTHLTRPQVAKKTIEEAKSIIDRETVLLEISKYELEGL